MQNTKQAIFELGEEKFGFDIMDVNTVEKYSSIEPVANFPKNLKGIIKLRGDVIPVYSLRRKFGLEDSVPNDDTRFIITTSKGILIAYEVDRMLEIILFEQDQINDVPSIVMSKETAYIKSIANVNNQLVIILDHDSILSEDEQSKIKAGIINKD